MTDFIANDLRLPDRLDRMAGAMAEGNALAGQLGRALTVEEQEALRQHRGNHISLPPMPLLSYRPPPQVAVGVDSGGFVFDWPVLDLMAQQGDQTARMLIAARESGVVWAGRGLAV